ncbi:hypothetical protein AAG570_011292, partial [Ranatra chinensis]
VTQSEQDRSCILLIRVQRRSGDWLWIHCVLQVKENMENSQQPLIVATNQVLSEREASVMRANSWLYHYYTVQSKLQYGLAYEAHAAAAAAAAATSQQQQRATPNYYQQQQQLQQQPVSPYHQTAQQQPHQVYHHQHQYGRRSEPEPVDYSVHSGQADTSPRSSPSSEVIVDLDRGGGGGTAILMSTTNLGRSRLAVKGADPADMMEQWNPSPPWSDTALQKVPDIMHQDLSPYVTTTPPTPGSAVSLQHAPHSAFSFDWTAEQYLGPEEDHLGSHHHLLGCFPWHGAPPPDHRLFPLQPPPTTRPTLIVRVDAESEHIMHHQAIKGEATAITNNMVVQFLKSHN